jgi:hypothetical protein
MSGRGKYNACPVDVDNIHFDSKAEAKRYGQLSTMARNGDIQQLEVHPRYVIWEGVDPDGKKQKITYVADFAYVEGGVKVTEDVKGGTATQTALFRAKRKMFICKYHDIEFRIVET